MESGALPKTGSLEQPAKGARPREEWAPLGVPACHGSLQEREGETNPRLVRAHQWGGWALGKKPGLCVTLT